MNMPRSRIARPLVLALALLAGCSSGTDTAPLFPQMFSAGKAAIAARAARRAEVAKPPLTRAVLNTVEGAYIEARIERQDITGYLSLALQRSDAAPGRIEQWRTQDNVSLTFRNGVLIATRGLGGDLVSAEVQVAGDRPGPATGGERGMHLRSGDLQVIRLGLACDLEDLGPETVTIVELSFATRHLRESCTTEGVTIGGQAVGAGRVVNDYWIDSRHRLMRKSRQWAGPEIGYVSLRRLTE
ncbi:YjbF family lipoprotein [Seohaeicola nanhaiensis]|uniref:YjbF family lipoprotein n=1 Tax=Seohaeicola nanhaiensis TaxID=1387282 RepID=A0ABV9KH92_9RHOB